MRTIQGITVQGILLICGLSGEWKNGEFGGIALGLVFWYVKSLKVSIWHLSINPKW